MELHKINDALAIAGQITEADVEFLAAQGYKTIICNRPDSEPDAIPSAQIAAKAQALGLSFVFQPVTMDTINAQAGAAFAANLREHAAPALAYCRSGRRCAMLWELAQQA